MSKALVGPAFFLGIIVLGAAMFLPAMMDVTAEDGSKTIEMIQGQDVNITDRLSLQLDRVNNSSADLNVTYENTQTLATNTTLINETETEPLNLSGDTIRTTADTIVDNTTAQLTIDYPPMFGWDSGPRTFMENMDIVLILLGFTLITISMIAFIPN